MPNGYQPPLSLVDLADPTTSKPSTTLCTRDRQLSRHAVVANATVQCSVDRWKSRRGPFAMTSTTSGGSSWSRKLDAGAMNVFTKKTDKLFSILAVGEFQCSVQELHELLRTDASGSAEYLLSQRLFWGPDVQQAEILHEIQAKDLFSLSDATLSSSSSSTATTNESLRESLYVKRVQFERPTTSSQAAEEWLHVDITTHQGDSAFTKTMAAIDPRLVYSDARSHGLVLDALAGIHVEAISNGLSRVIYYGETRRRQRAAGSASYNTIKTRLVHMAVATSRLAQFVPRVSFASSSSSSNFSVEDTAPPVATVCCSCCSKPLVLASTTRCSRCQRLACLPCCRADQQHAGTKKKNGPKDSVCRSCDRGDNHKPATYKYVKLSTRAETKAGPQSSSLPPTKQDPLVQMLQSTLELVDSSSKKESMRTIMRYLAEQEAHSRPYYIV